LKRESNVKTYLFQTRLTALSSISHIGDTFGVNARLRREKIITDRGPEEVPIISGNGLRGLLRDRGMYHMCRLLGYGLPEDVESVGAEEISKSGMSLDAFYFLFSGGALEKSGKRGIDVDEARKWREAIPLVSVFGGAMGNQIMPGKLKVGKAIPICVETSMILEDYLNEDEHLISIWDMVQEEAYTRKDDEKDENLRFFIDKSVRGLLEMESRSKRQRAGTDQDVVSATGQTQQMRYYVETLAAGSQFFWELSLDDATPVEFDALITTLAVWAKQPFIGGKSATGHGKVKLEFDNWQELNPAVARNGKEIDVPIGRRYLDHIEQNADLIRDLINGL
jgi:hypothetical protein